MGNVPGCGKAVTKEQFAEKDLFDADEDLAGIPYVTDDNKFEILSKNQFLAHVKKSNYLKGNRSVNVVSGKVTEKTEGDFIKNMQGAKTKSKNLLKVFSPPIGPVGVVGVRDFPNFHTKEPQKLHWSGKFWKKMHGLVAKQFAELVKEKFKEGEFTTESFVVDDNGGGQVQFVSGNGYKQDAAFAYDDTHNTGADKTGPGAKADAFESVEDWTAFFTKTANGKNC